METVKAVSSFASVGSSIVPVSRGLACATFAALMLMQSASANEVIKSHGISTFETLKYPTDFKYLEYVNPNAPKGGEISTSIPASTFDSFNPYIADGNPAVGSQIFYESLLTGTADEVGSAYGLLAESIEYPEDRSWVIFNMRPEARFSDGTPVTAEDVEFSYNQFLENGHFSFKILLERMVKSVQVEGHHRIRFDFNTEEPTREYPINIGSIDIFSKAWFEENETNLGEAWTEPPIGSSPYLLDSFDFGRRVVYKRRSDYWGSHLPIKQGRDNFDRIRFEYFADGSAAFEGFKSGVFTFRNENISKTWATEYDFPAIDNGWVVKEVIDDGSTAPGQSFVFNLRRDQFRDKRVRDALGLMFNFEWSNKTLFYDLYARIHSFWENSEFAATGLPDEAELALLEPLRGIIPDSVFIEPAVMAPSSNPDRQMDRENFRMASDLLDEAGWLVGDDGLRRNAAGETLKFEYIENSPAFRRIVLPFVSNLERLGVEAVYTQVDPAQMNERVTARDYDVITASFPMSLEPGEELWLYFGSEHVDGSRNHAGLASEGVDLLIANVIEASSLDELRTAVRALDRVLRAEGFWIPQWFKNVYTVAYFDMYEHPVNMPPYALGQMDFWWFNPEKAERLVTAGALPSGAGQ